MGTVFAIKNEGTLAVYDVKVHCFMRDLNAGFTIKNIFMEDLNNHADKIVAGHTMPASCEHTVGMGDSATKAEISIVPTYRPNLFWWHVSDEFHIEAEKSEDGSWIWKTVPR